MSDNSLTQQLMNEVYNKWQEEGEMRHTRMGIIKKYFTPKHKAAVQLGSMNYQVCNGGWSQWHNNGYSDDLEDLIEYAKRGKAQGIKHFDILLSILTDIHDLGEPDDYDDEEEIMCQECSGTGCVYTFDDEDDVDEGKVTCSECDGEGYFTEEIDGDQAYCEALGDFDDRYYEIGEDELIASFDEFIQRMDEEIVITEEHNNKKPICKLVGTDGNVFSIISKVSGELKKAGLYDSAKEFIDKAQKQKSYDDVLRLCFEYVDVR